MNKHKYWYKFYCCVCPVCGREDNYKERQYTQKPKDVSKRYDYKEIYDWCD